STQTAEGDVTLTFVVGPLNGYPIFDLRQTILDAWLDGTAVPVAQLAHHDFGGGLHAQLRVLESMLVAGSTHTLRVRYSLGIPQASTAGSYQPNLSWSSGPRLTFNFGFTDLGPGRYLEAWVPANLIFDQFDLTLELTILNTSIAHSIMTNGTVTVLGTNHFRVQWPAHSTALSTLLELRPSDSAQQQTDVVTLPVSGITVTVEAWKLVGSAVDLTAQIANIRNFLIANENDIGNYAHGNRFVAFFHVGGMEYDGATTTGLSPLRHETFHSWWGRGVKPASHPDGWWDEGWNEYNMAGGSGSVPFNIADPPLELSTRNPWSRFTPSAAYSGGREFFEGLAALMTAAHLRDFMDDFFASRPLQLATTGELEAHLLARSGKDDVVDAFHRFVYGFDDSASPDLWMKDEPAHGGADYWGGTFWNSPDLWVRNADDGGLTHQAPEYGQDNWFYARVRNRGAAARHFAVAFNCRPYAAFQFVYPDDFLPCITAVADFDLGPGDVRVVKARWPAALVPPAGTHACLLAAAIARNDHPATGVHVWEHNNLAQKNTTVVDLVPGDWIVVPFIIFNRWREWFPWFELAIVRPKGFETLRSELLYPSGKRPAESISERLDCGGGSPPSHGLDYRPWTSRNPDSAVAARFREAREETFSKGSRAGVSLKLPLKDQLMLGWRVWVPERTPAGTSFSVHLLKRIRFWRKTQGGLTLQIRAIER
ncbi:MAG: hypothetical protein ACREUU_09410, partial [Gammaproteobacteria bacterium]